jgi:hypothetical protein
MVSINSASPIKPLMPGIDQQFWRTVKIAPRAKALDGTVLVDLAFIFPECTETTWWPLQELLWGCVP